MSSEPVLLACANRVCALRGRPPLARLPELLAGTAHAVTGLDVLDPYRELRREPAVGPPALDVRLASSDPSEDLFGYLLGDAPPTVGLLRAWVASGLSGRVFVRRPTKIQRQTVGGARVRWLDSPEPPQTAIERARAVVHHGSMLMAEEALVVGRPQVVAPIYLEHLFTARALAANGVGQVIRPGSSQDATIATLAAASADGASPTSAAWTFARAHVPHAPDPELPRRLLRMVLPICS
jgi:hypothetical protein